MTIALGFNCIDGIVLCSDTQMTARAAAMKYNQSKICSINSFGEEQRSTIAITYAGDPDIMNSFFEHVNEALQQSKEKITLSLVRTTIQQALQAVHERSLDINTEFIDVICGVSIGGRKTEKALYVGKRTTLYEEHRIAIAGIGDSSLFRFLADMLPITDLHLTTENALLLGTYIVEQAKSFIDGCGGETGAVVMKKGEIVALVDIEKRKLLENRATSLAQSEHRRPESKLTLFDSALADRQFLTPSPPTLAQLPRKCTICGT
jgi:20S proteasome alpha/beta subunit